MLRDEAETIWTDRNHRRRMIKAVDDLKVISETRNLAGHSSGKVISADDALTSLYLFKIKAPIIQKIVFKLGGSDGVDIWNGTHSSIDIID